MSIDNPHDLSFREIFSDLQHTGDLLRATLPVEISTFLRYESLHEEKGSFIDEEMRELHSDMLFSIQTEESKDLIIYFLFEHKSYADKNIHRQLLGYLARIYKKMKPLRPVLPLVFYHGLQTWSVPLNFIDTIEMTQREKKFLSPYIPDFSYKLLDLSSQDIDDMILSLTLKSILYTFKHIWHLEEYDKLDQLFMLSRDLFDDSAGVQLLQKLLKYIYTVKDIEPEDIRERINLALANNKGDIAMSTAEKLIEKGIEKGMEKGILNEKIENARRMKSKGYPFQDISEITGLSIKEIEKL